MNLRRDSAYEKAMRWKVIADAEKRYRKLERCAQELDVSLAGLPEKGANFNILLDKNEREIEGRILETLRFHNDVWNMRSTAIAAMVSAIISLLSAAAAWIALFQNRPTP